MPGIDFDELRREIPMEQVLHLMGFHPTRRKDIQWYGRCPIPNCESPGPFKFSVNMVKHLYYCHGCRSGGNQLQLWARFTEMPLRPATIELCERLGREVPWLWLA